MIIVWILLGIVVLAAIWAVVAYNGLIGLRNKVEEGWRQIDVELKRRHDLIPNLVETVKGYAAHESGVFEEVTKARAGVVAAAAGDDVPAKAAADAALQQALVKVNGGSTPVLRLAGPICVAPDGGGPCTPLPPNPTSSPTPRPASASPTTSCWPINWPSPAAAAPARSPRRRS